MGSGNCDLRMEREAAVRIANDLTGRVVVRLTVIEREASADHARPAWRCLPYIGSLAKTGRAVTPIMSARMQTRRLPLLIDE